jgi:hypothetical protein
MADLMAQVRMPYTTGLNTDVSINVWSFTASTAPGALDVIADGLNEFYVTYSAWSSPIINWDLATIRIYNRADAMPRVPLYDELMVGDFINDSGFVPEEVAVALSFSAAIESGVPAGRRRGRVFLGPFGNNIVVNAGANRAGISSTFYTNLANGITDAHGIWDPEGVSHVVWSATDGVGRGVVSYSVDNVFDTMRSRGPEATSRTDLAAL